MFERLCTQTYSIRHIYLALLNEQVYIFSRYLFKGFTLQFVQFLHPALAGLTYWLRLQVVTFITGKKRRSFDHQQSENLLESFDPAGLLMEALASGSLSNKLDFLEDELPPLGCASHLGVCFSKTIVSQVNLAVEEEKVIFLDISFYRCKAKIYPRRRG